jgi:drug/metabolite transporter (DMT)-like permease
MTPNVAGIITLLIWTSSALLVTFVTRLPPLQLVTITWLVGAICLMGYYHFHKMPIAVHFNRSWKDYVFVTMGMGVYTALFYIAFKFAPAFEANTLNYLWPLFLMLFMALFLKAKLTMMNVAGMVAGFIGCVVLLASKQTDHSLSGFGIGHVVAIMAAALWGYYSCVSRTKNYPPGFLIPVFIVSAVLTYAAHLVFETTMNPTGFEWIILITLGLCRLTYVSWDYAMRHGNQLMLSSLSYLTPLGSSIVLIAGGHGAASWGVALAAALIIGGCIIVNWDHLLQYLRSLRP